MRRIVRRYQERGEGGLEDLSRAPKRRPRKTPEEVGRKVIRLKKETGWGFRRVAREVGMSPWTVRNILRRHGDLSRKLCPFSTLLFFEPQSKQLTYLIKMWP